MPATTASQLAQLAYEAAINPHVSAADSQAAATLAANAYRAGRAGDLLIAA